MVYIHILRYVELLEGLRVIYKIYKLTLLVTGVKWSWAMYKSSKKLEEYFKN